MHFGVVISPESKQVIQIVAAKLLSDSKKQIKTIILWSAGASRYIIQVHLSHFKLS